MRPAYREPVPTEEPRPRAGLLLGAPEKIRTPDLL